MYDEKEFLDLLHPYVSEETKKARRNVSFISFTIVTAALLQIPVEDIKAFGVDLSRSSEMPILILAFVLLLFWTGMLALSRKRDQEIQKERGYRLEKRVAYLKEKWPQVEQVRIKSEGRNYHPEHGEIKAALELYEAQVRRTHLAATYTNAMKTIEDSIPFILAVLGGLLLVVRGAHVL